MAVPCVLTKWSVFLVTFYCTCVAFSVGSPTRRQSLTEATSTEPIAATSEAVWDDSDEFDLNGEAQWTLDRNEWLKKPVTSSSSSSRRGLYSEDYDDYTDENLVVDGDDDDDAKGESEFLFLPPREARVLQPDDDDEDDSSQIKVRHTGRSSFSKMHDEDASLQVDQPVDVDLDDNDDDDSIAVDSQQHDEPSVQVLQPQEMRNHDDDDDDNSEEDEDDNMFDSPEEEAAQVIYGDHVFLY